MLWSVCHDVCVWVCVSTPATLEWLETWHSSSPRHDATAAEFGFKGQWSVVRVTATVRSGRWFTSPERAHTCWYFTLHLMPAATVARWFHSRTVQIPAFTEEILSLLSVSLPSSIYCTTVQCTSLLTLPTLFPLCHRITQKAVDKIWWHFWLVGICE